MVYRRAELGPHTAGPRDLLWIQVYLTATLKARDPVLSEYVGVIAQELFAFCNP